MNYINIQRLLTLFRIPETNISRVLMTTDHELENAELLFRDKRVMTVMTEFSF
jgi:hypothetical protein